jgi:hypothetical protein
VAHLAWRAQPPDEPADESAESAEEDAEVVDLTKQRLLGWLKGMFGGGGKGPPAAPTKDA